MLTFDAAARDVCQARRIRTNTPLQALTTLNDPVCHEAAVALAEAMHTQGGIAYGYQRALLAPPSPETLIRLQQLYEDARAYFDQHPREAVSMACNEREDSTEIAALAVVANAIMNLDAFLTK
jgi:hypothetical protein